jgi:predicted nucleotidyltransferase
VSEDERQDPASAAMAFVQRHFPTCAAAFLAGSAGRGSAHPNSDLDLVILADETPPHWATFVEAGWMIEAFVQTPASYPAAFARAVEGRWPLLLVLWAEGRPLVDHASVGQRAQDEARRLLAAGPPPLSEAETAVYRYDLTWLCDDLADAQDPAEALLIGQDLATTAMAFALARSGHWLGKGKWLLRNLRRASPREAEVAGAALAALAQSGRREPLLRFAEDLLQSAGGRRFEGQRADW